MKTWLRKNPYIALSILLAPILLLIGFVSAGFGHGNYVAARMLFPFACAFVGTYVGAAIVVSVLALLQWPAYGFLIDQSSHKVRTLGGLLIIHVHSVAGCLQEVVRVFNE